MRGESGVIIEPLQVTVTSACTAFQFQCELYPFFFYMVFLVLFIMIGALAHATTRGVFFLLLAGFALSSMFQVMLGLMPFTVPMLSLIVLAVYAWRM